MRMNIKHTTTARRSVAVNDAVIASAEIAREVQNHAGTTPGQAWQEATRALVIRQLLLQRAQALGLAATPRSEAGLRETAEEALIRTLLETEVRTPTADETECRRYYQANVKRFCSPEVFEPAHILFRAPRDDGAAFAIALQRAAQVLAEVQARPEFVREPGCRFVRLPVGGRRRPSRPDRARRHHTRI